MTEYKSLREKIAAETKARKERYRQFEALFDIAYSRGIEAGQNITPNPMTVTDGQESWHVAEGLCGFAWVHFIKANTSFAKWLVKTGRSRGKSYYGGIDFWISEFSQSHARKYECARAMAQVFRNAGIDCVARERLD